MQVVDFDIADSWTASFDWRTGSDGIDHYWKFIFEAGFAHVSPAGGYRSHCFVTWFGFDM